MSYHGNSAGVATPRISHRQTVTELGRETAKMKRNDHRTRVEEATESIDDFWQLTKCPRRRRWVNQGEIM